MIRSLPAVVLAVVLAVVAAACGGGGTESDPEFVAPTFTAVPTTTEAPRATTTTTEPPRFETIVSTSPVATEVAPAPSTIAPTTSTTTTTLPEPTGPLGAAGCVAELSLRSRAALLVWPAAYPGDWDQAVRIVRDQGVGGVVLMDAAGWTAADATARLAELQAASPIGMVVAVDEEGGVVQRLESIAGLPSQQEISENLTPAAAQDAVLAHGLRIAALGVDVAFGPVVDVLPEEGDPVLDRSRFFTGGVDEVTTYGRAYVNGWRGAGVVPVLKHYPGHGSATADTHATSGVTPPMGELSARDLQPYARLADLRPVVMVGHLTVPGLTAGVPATRSPEAVAHLRENLGYGDVLLVTDALGMGAVGLPPSEAAVQALSAGIDIALFTETAQTAAVIDAIVAAVNDGRLSAARVDGAARKVVDLLQARGRGCV